MNIRHFLASALCLIAFSAVNAQSPASEGEAGGGVICYANSDGYLIGTPEGWINHQDVASQAGICSLYTPEGQVFQTAEAVIYPQTAAIPPNTSGSKAIKILVDQAQEEFRSVPGGEKFTAKKSETIKTEKGQEFEIWLFNEGPAPNSYEAIAYHVGNDSVFFLVLASKTKEERDNALPVLKKVAQKMLRLEVSSK